MAAPEPDAFVAMTGITKRYAGVTALDDVDFRVAAGEAVCLAGENGSGKSTLIKILAGVEQPTEGEIRIGGTLRDRLNPRVSAAAGIMVIFQDFSLFPNLTVAENIGFATQLAAAPHLLQPQGLARSRAAGAGPHRRRHPHRRPGRDAARRAQAAGRHRPRARLRGAAHHHGRTHHRADRTRGARAPRHHPAAQGRRRGRGLRQPQAGRGAGGQRTGRGAAQRAQGRRGPGRRLRRGFAHPPHDRARRARGAALAPRRHARDADAGRAAEQERAPSAT
jgi:ABC-type sugar transport system ATPase subunit